MTILSFLLSFTVCHKVKLESAEMSYTDKNLYKLNTNGLGLYVCVYMIFIIISFRIICFHKYCGLTKVQLMSLFMQNVEK